MSFISVIQTTAIKSLSELYGQQFSARDFQVNETKPEFEGDYTIVLFSLLKTLKKSPEVLGKELGDYLIKNYSDFLSNYNVIKGFLNLKIADTALVDVLKENYQDAAFGKKSFNHEKIMVEYSSPNTNKPLHLGHLRNNFLGWSVAEILKANGNEVIKTSIVNDRGIHICKSMIAWQMYADGATPETAHEKGDHFVGDYYVKFNNEYKDEVAELMNSGKTEEEAEKEAPIMKKTQQMLLDWENGKADVRSLWSEMNGWVYKGFDETYKRIGSDFDHTYYESNTYLLGKDFVQEGLEKNILFKKEDGSVWIDLSDKKLDQKLVLRGDGTSVYITQDIGLAIQKFEEYHLDKSIYVIGDEQLHHMKVLKEIIRKLGMPFADKIFHLSYGMVELTTGKMKSREGTVVDADDLIDEMVTTAAKHTKELGKVKDFSEEELQKLYETLALGAMKFYLLRVDPRKRMVFNPEESIDFHGFTGPFVQYTYARIQSILRKVTEVSGARYQVSGNSIETSAFSSLLPLERQLIISLEKYSSIISDAAEEMNPSVIANYVFNLAKLYNSFYAEHSVANAENEEKKNLRLCISVMTANVIKSGMELLGIKVPDKM
ncbi:MAG TPA: arginine--tRNA ligase [Hanamia sp.]|nr:arginine--tRNA ligase [Hanamia sp.]